jgi:hypothetical protein
LRPPAAERCFAGRGLLLLVGVEDSLHALRVDGGRLDAGAFDLQQLADGTVARPPAAVHRFGQFLIRHVGEPHRHADLAAETDVLVQQPQREIGRVLENRKPVV